MSHTTTSLVVDFEKDSSDNGRASILLSEDTERSADFAESWVRLYHAAGASTKLLVNAGTVLNNGVHSESITTYAVFTGTDTATLSHPDVSSVIILTQGQFFDSLGDVKSTSISFDQTTNQMVSSNGAVFGVVKVKYTTKYRLYKYIFSGGPCPIFPEVAEESPYNIGLLFAFDLTNSVNTSLTLDPPECDSTFTVTNLVRAKQEFVIEEEPDDIKKFVAGQLGLNKFLSAETAFRVYPYDRSVATQVNFGSVVDLDGKQSIEVEEYLQFDGTSSVQISYPPDTAPLVEQVGTFFDTFNRTTSPNFVLPGDDYIRVDRPEKFVSSNLQNTVAGFREVVVTDSRQYSLPVYGIAKITYRASFSSHLYKFERKPFSGLVYVRPEFQIGFVSVLKEEKTKTLRLDPPSTKGLT